MNVSRRSLVMCVGLPALIALAAAALPWTGSGPGTAPAPDARELLEAGGPLHPFPDVPGWRPAGSPPADAEVPLAIFTTDETPDAAVARAADRFREAGWTPLPLAPDAGAVGGRRLAVFRSGGAVCWLCAEHDARTGRTRCVVTR